MSKKYNRVEQEKRFWRKIYKTPHCWLWIGSIDEKGYGSIRIGDRIEKAHRVSYIWNKGDIPKGMDVDHTCHKPNECRGGNSCLHRRCVNPDHLESVSPIVNYNRGGAVKYMLARIAAHTHCKNGHPYTAENLYVNKKGHRFCRACRRNTMRKAYAEGRVKKRSSEGNRIAAQRWRKKRKEEVLNCGH